MAEKVYRHYEASVTTPKGRLNREEIKAKEKFEDKLGTYSCLQKHLTFLVKEKKKLNTELQSVEGYNGRASFKLFAKIKKIEKEITGIHEYINDNFSAQEVDQILTKLEK